MDTFRVAVIRQLFDADGRPAIAGYDLSALADDPDVELVMLNNEPELRADELAGVDALIAVPSVAALGRANIPGDGRLALVTLTGVGHEAVDAAALTARDAALTIARDAVRRPTAAGALALMLATATRLIEKHRITLSAPAAWDRGARPFGMDLAGKTLGLVGLGNIGAEVARLAAPLGMRTIAHDPAPDAAAVAELGIALVGLDDLLAEADVVSLHCPLTPATRRLIDARRLELMKPTAVLINTARGGLVDQAALTRALAERRIAGAGLDVFDPEPPPADDPLLALDNVTLSAHAINWTPGLAAGFAAANVESVRAVMRGREPPHVVNRDVLARPGWRRKLAAYRARFGG